MAFGCGANCAKIILIIVNIIFFLAGVAVLAVGIWLLVDQGVLKVVNFIVPDNSSLFRAAAILLIVLGVFVLLVSILGFVGACIEHRTVLAVYIVLVTIVLAGQVACGIVAIVYKDEIRQRVDTSLIKSVRKVTNWVSKNRYYKYQTARGKCEASSDGAVWDYVQVKFNCCGVYNAPYSGYADSKLYQFCEPLNLINSFPVTCCEQKNELDLSDLKTNDQQELKKSFDCTQYKTQGCSNAVVEWIEKYAPVIIGMGIGVGMFELFVIVFALCLCQHVTYKDE